MINGIVPICATIDILINSHICLLNFVLDRINEFKKGLKSRIEATAQNDNWNPISNNHSGVDNNIKKAVPNNVFKERLLRRNIFATAKNENMVAARVTDVERPVKKANNHNVIIIIKYRIAFVCLKRFIGWNKNSNKA